MNATNLQYFRKCLIFKTTAQLLLQNHCCKLTIPTILYSNYRGIKLHSKEAETANSLQQMVQVIFTHTYTHIQNNNILTHLQMLKEQIHIYIHKCAKHVE